MCVVVLGTQISTSSKTRLSISSMTDCCMSVQDRHELVSKERQTESERASAADVARAAVEVQHAAEQQRTAQLTGQLQEAAVQSQVLDMRPLSVYTG